MSMRLNKTIKFSVFLTLFIGVFLLRSAVSFAQNPAGPPNGWGKAYNWNPGGSGWNYSVPQDFRYPPVWLEGYDPSGNIETLCNYPKKLLVPNMGAVFPGANDGGRGYQWGEYAYTTFSSTLYVEYWTSAYECWNSGILGVDAGSAYLDNTGLQITVNGVPNAIEFGNFNGASDPDRGGWGGNWRGYGRNVNLNPGMNWVCMETWGTYRWTQGGAPRSEPYGPLGYGCTLVFYDVPPDGNLDAVTCDRATGWAKDPTFPGVQPGDPNGAYRAINVQIYKDNWPENGGTFVNQGLADRWRPDVGSHGFDIDISSAQDFVPHSFYAVAENFNLNGGFEGYFHLGSGGRTSGPCRPRNGTIYVSKYEGPTDHKPADGIFTNVDNAINDAKVCVENQGGTEFDCNTNYPFGPPPPPGPNAYRWNGWNKGGIWAQPAPHNPYKVNIYVPAGWRLDHANRPGLTCTGPNNTGKCTVPNIDIGEGDLEWVDVWFERTVAPSCNIIQVLDPSAANNPFNSSIEVGQPMNIAFSAPTNLPPGATQFSISNLSSSPGGLTGFTGNHGPAALNSQIIVNGVNSAVPQRYTISYTVSWDGPSAGSTSCPGEIVTTTKPYLRVYGNDVKTGGSAKINSACLAPTNTKATILTFARGTSGASGGTEDWKGSSTQFAAFTLGEIAEFFSAGQNSPRSNTPPGRAQARPVLDLTFGNYDPNNEIKDHPEINQNSNLLDTRKVEGFGGVGGMAGCIEDYYKAISTGGGTAVGPTIGTRTISGAVAEYRDGDVVINGNIDFAGSWAEGNTPSYYLAVKGNIYIQPGVERISGVFIALGDGTPGSGRIYTCANGTNLFSATQLLEACNDRRLTINGAFVAKQVKFLRTIDSLRDGAPNEVAGASRAAEIFDFSPETYLSNPHSSLRRGSQKVQYDFITSLPPIL